MDLAVQRRTKPSLYEERRKATVIDGLDFEARKAYARETTLQLQEMLAPYIQLLPEEMQALWDRYFTTESDPSYPKRERAYLVEFLRWVIRYCENERSREIILPKGEGVSFFTGKNSQEMLSDLLGTITRMILRPASSLESTDVYLRNYNLENIALSVYEPTTLLAFSEWESAQYALLDYEKLGEAVQDLFPNNPNIKDEVSLEGVHHQFSGLLCKQRVYEFFHKISSKKVEFQKIARENPGLLTARVMAFPHELLLRAAVAEELAVSRQPEYMEAMADFSLSQKPAQELTPEQKGAVVSMATDFWSPRGIQTPMDTLRAGLEDTENTNTFSLIEWKPSPERKAHVDTYGRECFLTQDGKILIAVTRLEQETKELSYAGSLQVWKGARGFEFAHTLIMSSVHTLNERDISVRVLCEVDGVSVDLTLEMGGIITEMYMAHELPEGSNVPGLYELHYPTVEQHRQYESMTIPDADFLKKAHFVNLGRANAYDERLEKDARNPFVGQYVRLWHEKDHKTVRSEREGYVESVTTFVPTEPRIISFACCSSEVDSPAFRKLMHELVHRQGFHVVRIIRKTHQYAKLRGKEVDVFVLENIERASERLASDASFT